MKNKSISFFAPMFALGFLAAAGETSAQTSYTLLEELPFVGKTVALDSGGLNAYLQTIFNLGIGIAIALAVVMIVIGGAQYLSTDALSGKTDGRSKLTHAVGGLILALGIYIILYTVNPDILKLNLKIEPATSVNKQNISIYSSSFPSSTSASSTLGLNDAILESVFSGDAAARAALLNAGIPVNKVACKTVGEKNCTNVGGLPEQTIQGLIAFKLDCDGELHPTNCDVVVTGGTEWWSHAAHGPGKRVVDIRPTAAVNKFLIGQTANPSVKMESLRKWGGATWTFEPNGDNAKNTGAHWHVSNL